MRCPPELRCWASKPFCFFRSRGTANGKCRDNTENGAVNVGLYTNSLIEVSYAALIWIGNVSIPDGVNKQKSWLTSCLTRLASQYRRTNLHGYGAKSHLLRSCAGYAGSFE